MNRQVGPSIVLSVFIVCFFAVALFRHEPKRLAADRAGKQALRDDSGPRPSTGPPRIDFRRRLTAKSTGAPPPGGPVAVSETARPREAIIVTTSELGPPTIRTAASRYETAGGQPVPVGADVDPRPHPVRAVNQPLSAFTVVERDETIADVAVRIYGSTGAADALWRSNRDLLPDKDSPLTAGTLLRTPSVR